jgi:hypothetical protein
MFSITIRNCWVSDYKDYKKENNPCTQILWLWLCTNIVGLLDRYFKEQPLLTGLIPSERRKSWKHSFAFFSVRPTREERAFVLNVTNLDGHLRVLLHVFPKTNNNFWHNTKKLFSCAGNTLPALFILWWKTHLAANANRFEGKGNPIRLGQSGRKKLTARGDAAVVN